MMDLILSFHFLENIKLALSTKQCTSDLKNTYFRSLVYKTNNKGPRVDVLMIDEVSCRSTY